MAFCSRARLRKYRLVCCLPRRILRSQTNAQLAILVLVQPFGLPGNPTLHTLRPHRATSSPTTPAMHQKHHFPPPNHWVPSTDAKNATGIHILPRQCGDLQCASFNHDQPLLTDRFIRRRNGSMGSSRLLVLQRHPRRPRRIGQT